MPKVTGNNRVSALKRLGNPYSVNNLNRRPLTGLKTSSISDARQILVNRNKTSFDARQLLTRQSSKTDDNNNNGKMVVITGLKDMKIKDGRVKKNFYEKKQNDDYVFFLVNFNTNNWKYTAGKKEKDFCCWTNYFCYYS
jgi:hypothetical protein